MNGVHLYIAGHVELVVRTVLENILQRRTNSQSNILD